MTETKIYEKVTDHKKKLIIFHIGHLNKRPRENLKINRRSVIDISFQDIHSVYRTYANNYLDKVGEGYSVIFTYNTKTKTKILKFNTY